MRDRVRAAVRRGAVRRCPENGQSRASEAHGARGKGGNGRSENGARMRTRRRLPQRLPCRSASAPGRPSRDLGDARRTPRGPSRALRPLARGSARGPRSGARAPAGAATAPHRGALRRASRDARFLRCWLGLPRTRGFLKSPPCSTKVFSAMHAASGSTAKAFLQAEYTLCARRKGWRATRKSGGGGRRVARRGAGRRSKRAATPVELAEKPPDRIARRQASSRVRPATPPPPSVPSTCFRAWPRARL